MTRNVATAVLGWSHAVWHPYASLGTETCHRYTTLGQPPQHPSPHHASAPGGRTDCGQSKTNSLFLHCPLTSSVSYTRFLMENVLGSLYNCRTSHQEAHGRVATVSMQCLCLQTSAFATKEGSPDITEWFSASDSIVFGGMMIRAPRPASFLQRCSCLERGSTFSMRQSGFQLLPGVSAQLLVKGRNAFCS